MFFKRLKTLWKLSGIEITEEKKHYVNHLLSTDGVKERLGIKRMATIVEDPIDYFPSEEETV